MTKTARNTPQTVVKDRSNHGCTPDTPAASMRAAGRTDFSFVVELAMEIKHECNGKIPQNNCA